MIYMKSITVAALSAFVTVSMVGTMAIAQQSPVPQEGVEAPADAKNLRDVDPKVGQPKATAIKIDASSATSFKMSLTMVRKLLPKTEGEKLDKALKRLAHSGDTSLPTGTKNAVKSDEDIVYERHGAKLNGKSYKAILQMAE